MMSPTLRIEFELTDENLKAESRESAFGHWRSITTEIAAGDTRQFAKYYDVFFDLMYAEAKRLTRFDESQCLDIVQDSMLKAIKCMRPTEDFKQLGIWTRTVVKSVVYDRIRSDIARKNRDQEYSNQVSHTADQDTASEATENQARLIWIEEQINQLDSGLKRMFQLRFRLGWTLKRIAINLGLKTGAVDGKIRREIERIKKRAEQEFENEN